MEKEPDDKGGLFGDDDLDEAIAGADDTGMVKQQQVILEEERLEKLPAQSEPESPPP